jgi:hypothetical protein
MNIEKSTLLQAEKALKDLETPVLLAILDLRVDIRDITKGELVSRGYNSKGKFVGQKNIKT